MATLTLNELRRQATHLTTHAPRAIAQLEFIQSDPIRSPARAQDLILRHRVADYRTGDLERRYSSLGGPQRPFPYCSGIARPSGGGPIQILYAFRRASYQDTAHRRLQHSEKRCMRR
jgi:hypothetical protein